MYSVLKHRRWFLAGVTIALLLASQSDPANAAGTPSLDKYIISQPIPGWPPATNVQLDRAVSYLQNLEAAALGPSGATASVAAEGWREPASKNAFFIGLIGFSGAPRSGLSVDQQAQPAAKAAAASFCAGAVASSPVSTNPVSAIPGSYLVVCPSTPTGVVPEGVAWVKANVLAFMTLAQNSRETRTLSSLAVKQYIAMPALDTSVTSASLMSASNGGLIAIVATAALFAVLGTIVVLIRLRRKNARESAGILRNNSAAAALPRAGWYEDPTRLDHRRYWTGTEWGPGEPDAPETSAAHPS